MKIATKWVRLCNIICGILLIALLVCQFLPFWTMPACTCTDTCTKFDTNPDCGACKYYFKWCLHLSDEDVGLGKERGDYSKPWTISIQQYTWMPTFDSCDGATEYFTEILSTDDYEFMVKDVVLMPVLVFFGALFGAYFCLIRSKNPLCSIIPLIVGIAGIAGYLTLPIFQLGALWQVHVVLSALMLLLSLVPTVEYVSRAIDWLNPNKG